MNQEANARDYQKILEQQILKLNYRSFTQVVILGSSTFVPFMQLKARHRREVVEEILDIQIFSTMNLILKQRLKIILDDIRENDYQYELASEKISFQENHIADLKDNKEKIIQQKQRLIETNEKEISRRTDERNQLENDNENSLTSIDDKVSVETKSTRLKDIQSTLVEKHKTHTSMVGFFENNEDCPTCQQHIDEAFKTDMISQKRTEADKVQSGMKELKSELDKISLRKKEIKEITDSIRNNQVSIAKIDSSVLELKKFNVQLETEISQFKLDGSASSDVDKLKELKNEAELCSRQKSKLREDKLYAEAARNMLQDTGIKTKIIKQYLPIMNKLINKYLTSMEFYVNFTLDENFEETIKSRYRDEFSYASFSEGEKMRIDLALLFTWRAVAKMKNSTNTNLLILDEIFDSSLDGTGTDEFLKILHTLSGENVFVISHKQDVLADKFKSTIKFEKVKNFSHVAV
jgi:DNA repair exonuclease SbcCD ATPase subunit